MGTIYSARFIKEANPGSGFYSYTVPANMVAVVVSIDGVSNSAGAELLAYCAGTPFFAHAFTPPGSGLYDSVHWEGRCVLNAGEELDLQFAGNLNAQASGYLLSAL